MKKLIVSSLIVAIMTIGAGVLQAGKISSLAGSEWGFGGADKAFVSFGSGGKIHGHGGCNMFSGQYKVSGNKITIGPLRSTRKACPGAIMKREQSLFKNLDAARSFSATHLTLKLKGNNGADLLVLQRRDAD